MELWIGAVNLGFLYAFMAMGTFITYKLYSFPDITIDGTFTTGAAVASVLIVSGWNPFVVLPVAFVAGTLAGFITGFIHTRFRIEGLLAGILVMTGLYSVNLHLMGQSNIPLLHHPGFVTVISGINPGLDAEVWTGMILLAVILVFWLMVSLFLKTDFGLTMRSTGNNPIMTAAQGVSVNRLKIFGISLANGFVGISGALVAQYQGFADIGMGIGSIIFSLASVIIGEAIFRHRSLFVQVLGVICGSVIFRLAVALALRIGMNPNDLKIVTAAFVLLTLFLTGRFANTNSRLSRFLRKNREAIRIVSLAAFFLVIAAAALKIFAPSAFTEKKVKIGLLLANQSSLLTHTRNGFVCEIERLGYIDGKNCEILEMNAEGDIPMNRIMVDHMISARVDIFVPVSTASTQAVIHRVKDRPVVFATVADPFAIEAGRSEKEHLPNVTGVYGAAPVMELLRVFTRFYPGKQTIGTIYNPAFPNTKVNLGELRHAMKSFPQLTLKEVAVAGTSEVMQAAQSLASGNIRAFILINDLTVFNSLESVIKISHRKKIPVFTNDAERIADGVLVAYGYEYTVSGIQAARLVNRIIRGENPSVIPFEKYQKITFGLNYDVAENLDVIVPAAIIKEADIIVKNGKISGPVVELPGKPPAGKEK